MKFSKANAKIRQLSKVDSVAKYLTNKRKVYSFDLLSGHTCPYARDCHSKAVEIEGNRRKVVDGKHTDFRCFSASQEAFYTPLYNMRKSNMEILAIAAQPGGIDAAANSLISILPPDAGVIRIHVGGDFKTQAYFDAWIKVAKQCPNILFYAYTKSLPFWIKRIGEIPANFVLTASRGGMRDDLIVKHNLRETVVVESELQAEKLGLEIDHDDSHAADPAKQKQSFALLIHGLQPAGSRWGKAVKALNGNGSYKR